MKSLVSRGYSSGLIKIDDLSVDISTVAAKKGGQQKKAYWLTRCCSINIIERECKFYIQLKIQR